MKNNRGSFDVRFWIGCIVSALFIAGLFASTATGLAFPMGFEPTTASLISLAAWGLLLNFIWTILFHDDAEALNMIKWPPRIVQASSVMLFSFAYAAWACREIPDNAREICGVGFLMGIIGLFVYSVASIVGTLIGMPVNKLLIRKNRQQAY